MNGTGPWQVSIGERYTQQQRIEAGLNRILGLLESVRGVGDTPDTGAELIATIEAHSRRSKRTGRRESSRLNMI